MVADVFALRRNHDQFLIGANGEDATPGVVVAGYGEVVAGCAVVVGTVLRDAVDRRTHESACREPHDRTASLTRGPAAERAQVFVALRQRNRAVVNEERHRMRPRIDLGIIV